MKAPIALLAAALLASCGFSPMYGGAAMARGGPIGNVELVGDMPGKAGHVLRTELDRLLAVDQRSGGPAQQLQINLREEVIQLGLRLDESASRAELRLIADYTLTPADGGQALRGSLLSVVNYDIPTAAFGQISAQDDARERAAETLAQRVRAELALRLAQQRRS